jgi:glycosyltransferase 2 family protein
MSRFIVTIVDVVAALGGWLYARSHHLVSSRRARSVPADQDLAV